MRIPKDKIELFSKRKEILKESAQAMINEKKKLLPRKVAVTTIRIYFPKSTPSDEAGETVKRKYCK